MAEARSLRPSTDDAFVVKNEWDKIKIAPGSRVAITTWLATIVLLCMGAGLATVVERTGPLPAECAAKDRELMSRIREFEASRGTAEAELTDAFLSLVSARKACLSDVASGTAIYDVALRILQNHPIVSQK